MRIDSERGLTLTELTVVTALAAVVMLGLVGFYMNSQAVWMDASSQAITQREGTSLTDEIARLVRASAAAVVTPTPDSLHCQLSLYKPDEITPYWVFWWNPSDSLVHEGRTPTPADDRGAVVTSTVEVFQLAAGPSLVDLNLELRSAQHERVQINTRIAFQNR